MRDLYSSRAFHWGPLHSLSFFYPLFWAYVALEYSAYFLKGSIQTYFISYVPQL